MLMECMHVCIKAKKKEAMGLPGKLQKKKMPQRGMVEWLIRINLWQAHTGLPLNSHGHMQGRREREGAMLVWGSHVTNGHGHGRKANSHVM